MGLRTTQAARPGYRLIWFQHFHKSAGTSIVELAMRNGERLWHSHANGNPLDEAGNVIPLWSLDAAALLDFVDRCQALVVSFVATEWGLPLVATLRQDARVTLITCLRRPLDRLLSNFYFDIHYGYTTARTLDAYLASGDGVHTMHDYYTRILSRYGDDPRAVDRVFFGQALKSLGCFHHCALLETGLDGLTAALGWSKPLDRYRNRGSLHPARLRGILRRREWKHLWRLLRWPRRRPSAAFVARFEAQSAWDLRLYAHLERKCERRV
jgi:hypothetical protein